VRVIQNARTACFQDVPQCFSKFPSRWLRLNEQNGEIAEKKRLRITRTLHLNYICWSTKEVRIGYSEAHEFRKVSYATDTIRWETETNLITISAEPSTGFVKIMMDAPGERHIHAVSYGSKNIDSYVNF
jgi:hypothetical protein